MLNWFSFQHYARYDWTRHHQFTLPQQIQDQLRTLKDQTTIVVFLNGTRRPDSPTTSPTHTITPPSGKSSKRCRTSSTSSASSARSLGKVAVRDVEEEGYNNKLDQLAASTPGLRSAIDNASENCIFFCAAGRVQQLSFSE